MRGVAKRSILLSAAVTVLVLAGSIVTARLYFATHSGGTVTLATKIAQMLIVGFDGTKLQANDPIVRDIKTARIGGVILFDYNFQTRKYDKNITGPEQLQQLTSQLQNFSKQPLFIAIDYEGGRVNRLKEKYGFPRTVSASELGKLPLTVVRQYAKTMAKTLRRNHINFDFAPLLDVNVNPNNPVIGKLGRSFSANPDLVAERARVFSRAFAREKIFCAYKHFPGHGSSSSDSHKGFVDVTNSWSATELKPYKLLLQLPDACDFVMTAHIINRKLDPSGLPATLSRKILTGVLREKLHFSGIIVSDDMQMQAITKFYGLEKALKLALNAGVNIFIFGNQLEYDPNIANKVISVIEHLVQTGVVPKQKIDDAYRRIIAIKSQ